MGLRTSPTDRFASAVADGMHVEWNDVADGGLSDPDRAAIHQLRTIAAIATGAREQARRPVLAAGRRSLDAFAGGIMAIACVRVAIAAVCLVILAWQAGGWPAAIPPVFVVVVVAFAASGTILLRANRADGRAADLGLLFMIVATSFANGLYGTVAVKAHVQAGLNALPVDGFLAYAFWRFVRNFPTAPDYRSRRWLDVAAGVSGWAGLALLVANLAVVALNGHAGANWLLPLQRRSAKGTVYWSIVFGLLLPAIPTLVLRTYAAGIEARRRGWLFLSGLTLGLLPLSLLIVLEAASTRFAALSARHRSVVVGVSLSFLLTIPATTAYAVLVSRILDVRVLVRRTLQYALARTTLLLACLVPFGLIVYRVYADRDLPVAEVFGSAHVKVSAALLGAGFLLLASRQRLQTMLDRVFFRTSYDVAGTMASILDEAHRCVTVDELAAAAVERVTRTLGLQAASLMVAGDAGSFVAVAGVITGLPMASAIVPLATASSMPLYVDLDAKPGAIGRLPEDDLFWLADHDVRALVPLHGAGGSLIGMFVLGPARSDESLEQAHGAFIAALGAGLAGPLDHRLRVEGRSEAASPDAYTSRASDCQTCGRVAEGERTTCPSCAGETVPSAVPQIVAGKFRIEQRIGSGGMGVVYRAVDTSLGRAVAIKTLPKVNAEQAVRLRREGRTMATLSHPNLATVFGIETWRGTPMLVVEYLAGGTLADRLRRGPLPLDECVAVMLGVLAGLSHAHERGILHRDLKPSNIGFTADGVPKVLDFGLARLADDLRPGPAGEAAFPLGDEAVLTDRRVGTPLYMSPEALRGDAPGPYFDLWSAAVVMAEMLSGRVPDPTDRDLLPGNPPGEMVDLLRAALAGDVAERPRSAQEFRDRIARVSDVEVTWPGR